MYQNSSKNNDEYPIQTPKIAVLISTYNGNYHILDQILSILDQLHAEDRIFIRDDGSTDETLNKLKSLNEHRISFLTSSVNVGFARSFMMLIHEVPNNFEFYFLADQDDVWLPGKIKHAIEIMRESQYPEMVCTRLIITDNKLHPVGFSPDYKQPPSFGNAICQNIATGCTIAFNKSTLNFMRNIPLHFYKDNKIHYHDWWLYLNISYFGRVYFDPKPSVLYRQHQNNQIGMGEGLRRYLKIFKSLLKKPWMPILISQLNLFCDIHKERIKLEDLAMLHNLCYGNSTKMTCALLFEPTLTWQRPLDAWLFRILLIFEFVRNKI